MPIKYKVIHKAQPGVKGGGEKKYYASTQAKDEVSLKEISKMIEQMSTASEADVYLVMLALVHVMKRLLAEGNIVRLGDLGSLRITLNSEGKATDKEVNAASIKGARVVFAPGVDLKELILSLKYEKA